MIVRRVLYHLSHIPISSALVVFQIGSSGFFFAWADLNH
jgi:hypothetical protein